MSGDGTVRLTEPPVFRGKRQPADCASCDWPIDYWSDPEGIWAECACSGGYLW